MLKTSQYWRAVVVAISLVDGLKAQTLCAQMRPSDIGGPSDRTFRIQEEPTSPASPMFAPPANDDGESLTTEESRGRSGVPGEGVDGKNDRLIDRVVDPISWLMDFRFREDWNWPVGNSGPDSQQFEFRPTIPFKAWDQVNLLRVTIPYDIQGSSGAGLDKVTVFDALIFEPDWGRWGFGPEIRFDPHSTTGQDEFQIGPVFGAVTKSKHWTAGFICQNFLSGNNSETQIQPILAYKFNDKLALAIGDMQFKYDWNKRQWTQLPLGIELDYIADLWGQKMQFFVNPQYNFETNSSSFGWTVFVGFTLLVPDA
jgi:hypothetical protein